MKLKEKRFYLIAVIFLIITQCTMNRVHKESSMTQVKECPPLILTGVDTAGYTIFFSDSIERKNFLGSLNDFLKRYPLSYVKYDSVSSIVFIKLAPFHNNENNVGLSPVKTPIFTEDIIMYKNDTTKSDAVYSSLLPEVDTIVPEKGGTIKIWSERKEVDAALLPLIGEDPFACVDTGTPFFEIGISSEKKITLQIKKRIYDSKGRIISALDIIDSWIEYIKRYPAEGLFLFRHVEGIKEFIEGKEVIIRGMIALDQKTISLRLSEADEIAVDRLKNIRLNGGVFSKIGVYSPIALLNEKISFVTKTKEEERAIPDTLIVSFEEDKNPLLSFSLKKYNGVILSTINDLNYARTTLQKNTTLYCIAKERYFIGCRSGFEDIGRIIESKVNREELLKSVIMAEGEIINSLENDSYEDTIGIKVSGNAYYSSLLGKKVRIICRKDDAFSVKIGEKILAVLLDVGINSELIPLELLNYQRALVDRNYECVIGWVSQNVKTSLSERLRLATIWFEDKNDEKERIDSFVERPLFSINRYLLLRKPAGLYRGNIEGLYASYKRKE